MKDSQIGTYGVLALGVVTGLRWLCYGAIIASGAWLAIVAAASLSRATLPLVMALVSHARATGLSHHVGRPTSTIAVLALVIGMTFAVLCIGIAVLPATLAVLVTAAGMAALAKSKIGGQTGDVLGATQQLAELSILLILVAQLGA